MSSSFSFPYPRITIDDLEDLHTVYGVDRAVILDLASAFESPETVEEHMAELISLSSNLAVLPSRFRSLYSRSWQSSRNKQNPKNFLVSQRPGRHVIEDVPYRDEKWREQFFVFKTQIRAAFAMPEETNMAPPGIGGGALLGSHCDFFRPSSVFRPIGQAAYAPEERRYRLSLGPGSETKLFPGPVRDVDCRGPPSPVTQDDLISLAGRMRFAGCRLPSLISLTEKEANAKVAVTSSNVMEAFNEYAISMEDRVEISRKTRRSRASVLKSRGFRRSSKATPPAARIRSLSSRTAIGDVSLVGVQQRLHTELFLFRNREGRNAGIPKKNIVGICFGLKHRIIPLEGALNFNFKGPYSAILVEATTGTCWDFAFYCSEAGHYRVPMLHVSFCRKPLSGLEGASMGENPSARLCYFPRLEK
ncbi:hypothetical protein F2Q69_00013531 [Brassica cretica]|uniref:Uncharacterized protein n=1 Tax=Brassica cretica TaxID=69181 RepID=A0A8S9QIP6_BRACR|nr:hypothetical protein F2Q69_00013531 [Brassica cretica]